MNVNELLDTIEDALEESANVPLSGGKRIVDVEQIRDYLDEVRAALPGELRQAQQIVNDRAQIVDSANAQAQAIVKKAEERARILVSDAEIVKAAQQRAAEIDRCCPDRGTHPAPDRDRLLREYAAHHRGHHGGKRRTGQKHPQQPAPERQEKRLITANFPHKFHTLRKTKSLRAKMTAHRDFFCGLLRQKAARKPLHSQA